MLGLKHRSTVSRCYGLLDLLRGNARQYFRSERTLVSQPSGIVMDADNRGSNNASGGAEQQSMKSSIERKLREALTPTVLVVDDVSHQHAGHAGVSKGAIETHFNVKVVSEKFMGSSLIKRHRLIYELLDEELKNGVHAVSLVTKSPSEAS